MPPSNARAILSSSIRCNARANPSIARRTFASSPALREVGPESPKYIDFPQPLQQTAPFTPVVKGSLPVPRNIFINRSQLDKSSGRFLDDATPEPSKKTAPSGPHAERLAWNQRLSALRRRNLREGVTSLHQRKQKMDQYLASRGARRQDEQKRLINKPPRDDEVFTTPSISKDVIDFLNKPRNNAKVAQNMRLKRANIEKSEALKSHKRREALHTLFMHAREYIVTEKQLSDAIDSSFGSEDNLPGFSPSNSSLGRSIWARGTPQTTVEMLNRSHGHSKNAMESNEDISTPTQKRIHRIAEELTGGKI